MREIAWTVPGAMSALRLKALWDFARVWSAIERMSNLGGGSDEDALENTSWAGVLAVH